MLASPGPAPTEQGWAREVKWDGMRAQLRFDGRRVCVRSRPGRNCTAEFPELVELHDTLAGREVILDGELVFLLADGKPDFAALRGRLAGPSRRARGPHSGQLAFMAFDVLHLDGRAVRHSRTGVGASCWPNSSSTYLYVGRRGTSSERARRCSRRPLSRASRAWWPSGSTPPMRRGDVATRGSNRSTGALSAT
jgi:hypothetical protein